MDGQLDRKPKRNSDVQGKLTIIPALAFFTTILFVPGIPDPATVPRWALLMLIVPILWYRHPNRMTWGHVLGACFLAWAALSLRWTFNLFDGARALMWFGMLALLFCAAPLSLRRVYGAMAIGLATNSAAVVAQIYGWDGVSQAAPPAGLFFNKNFGGDGACRSRRVQALVGDPRAASDAGAEPVSQRVDSFRCSLYYTDVSV